LFSIEKTASGSGQTSGHVVWCLGALSLKAGGLSDLSVFLISDFIEIYVFQ
jgi:hypothetical protein